MGDQIESIRNVSSFSTLQSQEFCTHELGRLDTITAKVNLALFYLFLLHFRAILLSNRFTIFNQFLSV